MSLEKFKCSDLDRTDFKGISFNEFSKLKKIKELQRTYKAFISSYDKDEWDKNLKEKIRKCTKRSC